MFGKSKDEKQCPAGHVMEESWERCPYCEAEREAVVEPTESVVVTEGGKATPADPGTGVVVVSRKKADPHPLAGWLVALTGAQAGEDFRVRHGRNTLGKSKEAAIMLKDPLASERHALLNVGVNATIIADLDSKHGTQCNGEPVTGDIIRIGATELKFRTFEF
jgi:hypothetical protein